MTYPLKTMAIAALCATILAAQTVGASAMGSDREPDSTNMIVHVSPTQLYPTQKNAILESPFTVGYNDYTSNQAFADQK
ncbi:MAG: hypothetical protein QM492_11370 [Rhodobacterales bacterium]